MSITYECDDQRRLITVTVTEPYSVDDIFGAIDRQAAEDTWGYAVLYDLRAPMSIEADSQHIADHVQAVGGGRERGSEKSATLGSGASAAAIMCSADRVLRNRARMIGLRYVADVPS